MHAEKSKNISLFFFCFSPIYNLNITLFKFFSSSFFLFSTFNLLSLFFFHNYLIMLSNGEFCLSFYYNFFSFLSFFNNNNKNNHALILLTATKPPKSTDTFVSFAIKLANTFFLLLYFYLC